jgi:orotate phosphoribosyltransferase
VNYRSVADLNEAIQKWAEVLPRDISLVVGIPRSGLLAANLLALHRNLPLTDLDRFLDGKIIGGGRRMGHASKDKDAFSGRILVVDDSIHNGIEMARVKARLTNHPLSEHLEFGAVYATYENEHLVDWSVERLETPRIFEWNLFHHPIMLKQFCADIDGVLCRDPTDEENDDGERYLDFITRVEPRIVPSCEIGWLVTSRLEKYRGPTKRWLARNNIRYRELIMMDYPTKAARRAAGNYSEYKANVYRAKGAMLFIESNLKQAQEIARIVGQPVYCVESRGLVEPAPFVEIRRQPRQYFRRLIGEYHIGRTMLRAYNFAKSQLRGKFVVQAFKSQK